MNNRHEALLINIRKGLSGTGDLFAKIAERKRNSIQKIHLEPGDQITFDLDGSIKKQLAAPIGYDLWYLRHDVNILTQETSDEEERKALDAVPQEYLDGPLDFLEEKLGGIKPLCFIRDLTDLFPPFWSTDVVISEDWIAKREYFVHLMPFEMWGSGLVEVISSDGADTDYGFKRNEIVGYFTFPVGQLGVQEVISILRQSVIEKADFNLTDDLKPVTESTCDFFFPPINEYTGKNNCVGDHLIESGYVVVENKKRGFEWQSPSPPPETYYIEGRTLPKMWMRYWFHNDDTFPIPGEFLGILCKPLALPPHVWWFQETSPFLYAGNWFETYNLTGGVITEITLEANRTDNGIGKQYKIKVQGREIILNASDFSSYSVGDRVGILKVESVTDTTQTKPFMWTDQVRILESDTESIEVNEDYVIIPIEFYK